MPDGGDRARPVAFASKSLIAAKPSILLTDLSFSLPGRLNVVADALSRDPFVKPLRERLLHESYSELLNQVCDVNNEFVQDTLRLTCQPQSLGSLFAVDGSRSEDEVSSLLLTVYDWESAPRHRAASLADHLSILEPPGQDMLPSFSLGDLQSHQQQDPVILRVVQYVDRKRRPSRCERYNEDQLTLRVLNNGID